MKFNYLIAFSVAIFGYAQGLASPTCPNNRPQIIFYADPEDCSMYYECYSGTLAHMNCPAYLYWSTKDDTCDRPENVDCGDRPIPKDPPSESTPTSAATTLPTVPTEASTSASTPTSAATTLPTVPTEASTSASTPTSAATTLPTVPTEASTSASTTTSAATTLPTVTENTATTPSTPGTTASSTTPPTTQSTSKTPTTPSYDPNPQCPASGQYFYPDPSNCKEYFECDNGTRYTVVCPDKYLYNVNAEGCDLIENVDCSGRSTNVPTTTEITTISVPPTFDPNPQCPASGKNISFYPDPANCKQYFECNRGKRYTIPCPDDLLYNVKVEACDIPINVDCSGRSTNVPTTTEITTVSVPTSNTPTTPSTNVPTTTEIPTTYIPPTFDPNPQCPSSEKNISFYPDPANCKQYFECNRGKRFTIPCPDDLLYNVKVEACDIPTNVDCSGRSTNVPTTTEITTISVPPTFDPNPQCPTSEKNISFYPDPANCKQYFECNRGKRFTIPCPDDLLYNVKVEACDIPTNVDCSGRSTNVPATTEITTVSIPTSTHRTTVTLPPSTVPPTTPKYVPGGDCRDKADGEYVGNPYDCKIFYECMRGNGTARRCQDSPQDLYWCQNELTCDVKDKPGCVCWGQ